MTNLPDQTESSKPDMVELRNGATEFQPLVGIVYVTLADLWDEQAITVYELVMLCRDPKHKLSGSTATILKEHALLEADGQPHDSTRNIVLSAVEGDGLDMTLRSPIADARKGGGR